jgi:hypothetical protein
MFISFGCSIYITISEFIERLQLLISRAASSSKTISNGLTFLIKSSLFSSFFKSHSKHENMKIVESNYSIRQLTAKRPVSSWPSCPLARITFIHC